MNEPTKIPSLDESKAYFEEKVLDHLGTPRPFRMRYLMELEEKLLPQFAQMSRHAWNAASALIPPNDPSVQFLQSKAKEEEDNIPRLDEILQDLGIHDLMGDIANSPHLANLPSLPIDPYEIRMLKAAGHPNPETALLDLLEFAVAKHEFLASSSKTLGKASLAVTQAGIDLSALIKLADSPIRQRPTMPKATPATAGPGALSESPKPKRLKVFNGMGKLASGLVLLAADPSVVLATTIITGPLALAACVSFASGIASVGQGIGDLLREGE